MSVISGVAPNSPIYLYGAAARTSAVGNFQAYQNAFFDGTRNPEILSSSYTYFFSMTANSPFQQAWQQLFVDGMLSGVRCTSPSATRVAERLPAQRRGQRGARTVPTYALSVGGTSIATPFSTANDGTLGAPLSAFPCRRPGDALQLVAAGLMTMPTPLDRRSRDLDGSRHRQLRAALRAADRNGVARLRRRQAAAVTASPATHGSGGVDQTQPVPVLSERLRLTR